MCMMIARVVMIISVYDIWKRRHSITNSSTISTSIYTHITIVNTITTINDNTATNNTMNTAGGDVYGGDDYYY